MVSSQIQGTFYHSNTIEEYNAIDLNNVVSEESKRVCDASDMNTFNKFVIVSFGDLKNYIYEHRVAIIELEGSFAIAKSNKASNFIPGEELGKMGGTILEFVKANEETPFAFSMSKSGEGYEID